VAVVRRKPFVGDEVTLVYLAHREPGIVEHVDDDGRAVTVAIESGDLVALRMNATGQFVSGERSCRLVFGSCR
jgi:hypothetical protein